MGNRVKDKIEEVGMEIKTYIYIYNNDDDKNTNNRN